MRVELMILAAFKHLLIRFILILTSVFLMLSETIAGTAVDGQLTEESEEVYMIDYFLQYAPQTALDIIQYVPGFVLDTGDDIRGFGAGAGNVLIAGTRPSSKSGGIEEALRRIPAAQVLKVEVIRGSVGAGEAAGQSVIANVIRVQDDDTKLWKIALERAVDGFFYPNTELTLSQTSDVWKSSLKTNIYWERTPREAVIENRDANQELLSSQSEDRPSRLGNAWFSGDARRQIGLGTLQLNGRLAWSRWKPDTDRLGFNGRLPDNSPDTSFMNRRDSEYYTGEIGADWTRTYQDNWVWRLLGVSSNRNWWVNAFTRQEEPVGQFDSASIFRFDEHKSETILRTTFAKTGNMTWRPEYGAEIVYNRLQSSLGLRSVDSVGQTLSVLRTTYALVDELRSEAFTNVVWNISQKITLEMGIAAESSRIAVSGDAENSESLFYWKPSMALAYDHTNTTQYRFTLRRSVGQLDFSDFAAQADLIDNRQISGNPELRPDRITRSALSIDHRFAERGAINVELFHEWRKDVLEQIVLPSRDQAIGNAGDARFWGMKVNLNLPLQLLIRDALLEIEANTSRSRFDDPITGEVRELTDITRPDIQINFRQDRIPAKVSWGVNYRGKRTENNYFVNEHIRTVWQPLWSTFIETTRFQNVKARLELSRLGQERERRQRWIYQTDRSGELVLLEDTHRSRGGAFISMTVNGSF